MEFLIESGSKIYEISELVNKVSWTDKLNDGCSKLEFNFIDDNLSIGNGSAVRLVQDKLKLYGQIYKHGHNKNGEISVTSYDQLRRAKAKDTIVCKNDTVTTLAKKMCNYFNMTAGTLINTGYTLPVSVQDDKTWLDIIYGGISETLTNKGKWYSLRDEYGKIALRDLDDLTLDLVLGDENLCYDYEYEKSIDEDFYNVIKLAMDNETTGKREVYIAKDSTSINKYGLLQYFEVLDKNGNSSKAKAKADTLLRLYNRESEMLTLKCLGDTRVRAGSSFYGRIEDIKLNRKLIVRSVTHDLLPVHTMTLEVML